MEFDTLTYMTIIIYNLVNYECQGKASFIYGGKPSSQQASKLLNVATWTVNWVTD